VSKIPTLEEIVQAIDALALQKRKRAPQGCKPTYGDSFILGLAVYQKLAGFRFAQQMLGVLRSLGVAVPSPATFCERKARLMDQLILTVKQLCTGSGATRQHLDSKKLEVIDVARANRTNLAGRFGFDHIHDTTFYGFRRLGQSGTSRACPLHALVDDTSCLCRVLLQGANKHDVKVAPRLLNTLRYTIVTADKGYLSRALKTELAPHAVDLVTPRRRNQLPPPAREKQLYKGHRRIESGFSSLDRLGLAERPYRSTEGFILHLYTTLLAFQLDRLGLLMLWLCLSRIGVLL